MWWALNCGHDVEEAQGAHWSNKLLSFLKHMLLESLILICIQYKFFKLIASIFFLLTQTGERKEERFLYLCMSNTNLISSPYAATSSSLSLRGTEMENSNQYRMDTNIDLQGFDFFLAAPSLFLFSLLTVYFALCRSLDWCRFLCLYWSSQLALRILIWTGGNIHYELREMSQKHRFAPVGMPNWSCFTLWSFQIKQKVYMFKTTCDKKITIT